MDERYAKRKEELLAECQVPPEVFAGLLERLRPFALSFYTQVITCDETRSCGLCMAERPSAQLSANTGVASIVLFGSVSAALFVYKGQPLDLSFIHKS